MFSPRRSLAKDIELAVKYVPLRAIAEVIDIGPQNMVYEKVGDPINVPHVAIARTISDAVLPALGFGRRDELP